MTTSLADQFIDTLVAAGVKRIYGVVGDNLNGLIDVARRRGDIEWVHVRHEEGTFATTFCTFAISFWPYMIPFSITIDAAAAPHTSLAFMFWGDGLIVLRLKLGHTAISCRVFHGKARSQSGSY